MTDQDPDNTLAESIEPVTSTLLLPRPGEAGFPSDLPPDPGSEDWPTQVAKRGIRLRIPTAILLALLLAAGGLWGGSVLQKQEGGRAAPTGAAAGRVAFNRTGGAGASAAASRGTAGTVTDIIGNTLYVTNSSGQLIKVTLSPSATVTRNASSSLSGLRAGDTVIVQGTTPKNGSMTASSVAATAKGVSSTGGFAPGGGFGGAAGGGVSRSSASS